MKKILILCICILMTASLTACGGKGKKLQAAYDTVAVMSFSDESILTEDESSKLAQMIEKREEAFKNKDIEALESLKQEWDSFSTPINSFIEQYQNAQSCLFTNSETEQLTSDEKEKADSYKDLINTAYRNRDEEGLKSASEDLDSFSRPIKEIFDINENLELNPFTDAEKTLLSEEDISKMDELADEIETAVAERNLGNLKSVSGQWEQFVSNTTVKLEQAKEKLLKEWVDNSNATASFTNLFSLGMVTSSTTIEGHKIIYTTQYNTDVNTSDEQIKASLDSYIGMTSSIFQSGVEYLQQYIDDVCIRIEYRNKDGNVIAYKEFN